MKEGKIKATLVLDFDLNFGDGTANIFHRTPKVIYFHPQASDRQKFIDTISQFFGQHKTDIIGVSAGFDRHEADGGGMLTMEDYRAIGKTVTEFAEWVCSGRRYCVLEGGYNHYVLGKNVRAFFEGMG